MTQRPSSATPDDPLGRSLPRIDAAARVTGATRYSADLVRPGMLHAALLGSPHAHARIRGIDTSRARALPGVRAVLTARDLPDARIGYPFILDQYVLARDRVRHAGEAVAAVAADDEATARRAVACIDVDWEPLPAVFDPAAALAPEAPLLHPGFAGYRAVIPVAKGHNLCAHTLIAEGDAEAALAGCDVVVEGTYTTPAQQHFYLEPCAALAEVDDDGRVTVWSGTQSVFRAQAAVALALGLPHTRVRCLAAAIGGAFGGKGEATVQPIAAALALATRRPVRLVLSREEDIAMMRSRHAATIRMRTGARRDGTLVARTLDFTLDGGAYADSSPGVVAFAAMLVRGPYRIPHVRAEGRAAYTNKLRGSAMRGFGNAQIAFASESQIDELAARLGIDPLDLRLRNAMVDGDTLAGGHRPAVCSLRETLERVRAACDWDARRARARPAGGPRRGVGVAGLLHCSGLLGAGAFVRLAEDGTLMVVTGYTDVGGGAQVALTQIAAATLRLDAAQVHLAAPDTDAAPYNHGAHASRTTHMVGAAIERAAAQVREQILRHAGEMLECGVDSLELRPGGRVGVVGVPAAEVPFAAVAGYSMHVAGGPITGSHSWLYTNRFARGQARIEGFAFENIGGYGFGAQVSEVEVDPDTGAVKVLNVWSAHDVGRAVNPAGCEGQIAGGIVQGMGYALLESLEWSDGHLVNGTAADYRIPGFAEAPAIHPILVENPEPGAPYGARGIGEPSFVGAAPSIAAAVRDAIGVAPSALPMTPERVLNALARKHGEDPPLA